MFPCDGLLKWNFISDTHLSTYPSYNVKDTEKPRGVFVSYFTEKYQFQTN